MLISRRGKNKCKSLTQSSTWLETKAFPFTLVKGLLEVKSCEERKTLRNGKESSNISTAS